MNTNTEQDEFYIGYSAQIPPKTRKFLFIFIPLLVISIIILGIIFPLVHNQFTTGTYTPPREYTGLVIDKPIPQLVIPRQGNTFNENNYSQYILASTRKFAVDEKLLALSGKWVKLKALPVFRDNMTMLAVSSKTAPEVIAPPSPDSLIPPQGKSLGTFTFNGEIVDSKCYLGVMNPGHSKTHRECAVRCISGGIPPALKVVNEAGISLYFLLVDSQDKPVNFRILGLIADPVKISGEVIEYGNLLVLKANPETYKLL